MAQSPSAAAIRSRNSAAAPPPFSSQALYFCVPFREQLLEYYSNNKIQGEADENLLTCLAELFTQISSQKKKTGVIAPKRFVHRVRKENELFRGYMHQGVDIHFGLAIDSTKATLAVERRLACEMVKY